MSDLITHFSKVTDLRSEQGKRHKLIDIIAIAIVGVICGADDWVSIEMVGQAKEKWFRTFLELPHGIPSHDTFGKVFAWIDPKEFQASFSERISSQLHGLDPGGSCDDSGRGGCSGRENDPPIP